MLVSRLLHMLAFARLTALRVTSTGPARDLPAVGIPINWGMCQRLGVDRTIDVKIVVPRSVIGQFADAALPEFSR